MNDVISVLDVSWGIFDLAFHDIWHNKVLNSMHGPYCVDGYVLVKCVVDSHNNVITPIFNVL